MAATWVARQAGITHASGKSMIDVFNANTTTRVLRGYLFYLFNNGVASVTGVISAFAIRRISSTSGGSSITPIAFDTNSSPLTAQVTAGHGRTVGAVSTFRSFLFSNEEPTATGAGYNNLLLLVPFAEWGRYGVDNSDLEPIVCRDTEGTDIAQTGTSAVGSADAEIIFTDAAS